MISYWEKTKNQQPSALKEGFRGGGLGSPTHCLQGGRGVRCEVGTGTHLERKLDESESGLPLGNFSFITCKIEMTHMSVTGLLTVIITITTANIY